MRVEPMLVLDIILSSDFGYNVFRKMALPLLWDKLRGDLMYICIKLYFSFNNKYIFPVITDKHFSVRWIGRGGPTNSPCEVPFLLHIIYSYGVG
jgi:hypothetical protein